MRGGRCASPVISDQQRDTVGCGDGQGESRSVRNDDVGISTGSGALPRNEHIRAMNLVNPHEALGIGLQR